MANNEHLAIIRHGVKIWNRWRKRNRDTKPNLEDADLSSIILSDCNLSGANLQNSSFRDTVLFNTNFSSADLSFAQFHNANLRSVNFSGANFTKSKLNYANLQRVHLNHAYLGNTYLDGTTFSMVDLSEVIGLDTCIHYSPSTIDNQTLYLSDSLPEIFLKGIGLADWEIEQTRLYQKDLSQQEIAEILNTVHQLRAGSPIQVHNLFISYAHKDSGFVNRLSTTLDEKGTRFWRDINDLPDAPAGPLDRVILKEMKGCVVLLILSENSISSDWVRFEMESAAKIGIDEGREVLLPIALDDSWKDYKWPLKLKDRIFDYNIIDFSQWQNENIYKKRFAQVLEGLNLFYKDS